MRPAPCRQGQHQVVYVAVQDVFGRWQDWIIKPERILTFAAKRVHQHYAWSIRIQGSDWRWNRERHVP